MVAGHRVDQLARDLPRAVQSLRDQLSRHEWGRALVAATPTVEQLMSDQVLLRASGVASRTFGLTVGGIVSLVIVTFVGLYVAANPGLYARGIVRLVPPARRERAREVLAALRSTLQWWLIGQVIVMAVVGVLTGVGLWRLGMPLALTLGLLAGLLNFIPYFGPVLAFGPAVLLALTQGMTVALYVGALYFVIQALESYILTPLVQQRVVSLPPALTIGAQVVLTVLFGGFGLLLATPLTGATFVLVKMLYVEDVLGDAIDVPEQQAARHRRRSA
ncbi:MAG: AI-2E family transporter [Candidatus Rokuibacteriota bacterium]